MFDKIKRLGTETAIYGVSTILGRFLTFILTPVYANMLPPSEVGIIATVYAYIGFLNVLYGYGMEGAYMKYTSTLEIGNRKQNFFVPFLSLTITSVAFSLFIIWQSESLAAMANLSARYQSLPTYTAWVLFLDALSIIPFASLRMAGKARQFASIRLANIIVNVACNLLFLLYYKMGIEGIFYSNIIASAFSLVLLIPTIISNTSMEWSGSLYRALLRFAVPTVPSFIATMMIQVIDRPILEALTDKATVGIYQANYRLGIFMMLIVSMFDFAWRPFFLSHANEPDAKPLFARVLTYFMLVTSSVFLIVSFFIDDIVKLPIFWGRSILPEPYWAGLSIVPVVLLAYVFLGISNNVAAGIYIEKRTRQLPAITFLGAFVNIVANFLLIPILGIMGAAIATLLSYAVMAIALYIVVRRFYPVEYEFGRIVKISLSALIVFVLYLLVKPPVMELLWKCALLVLFGALMYWMKFFEREELKTISHLFRRQGTADRGPEIPPEIGT
jgi:O-antigen/teichoic acid export membrane protein